MKGLLPILFLTAGLTAACDDQKKPTEDECQRAIAHILELRGNAGGGVGPDPKKMVNACRSSSTEQSVSCFLAAESEADLTKCEGKMGALKTKEPPLDKKE